MRTTTCAVYIEHRLYYRKHNGITLFYYEHVSQRFGEAKCSIVKCINNKTSTIHHPQRTGSCLCPVNETGTHYHKKFKITNEQRKSRIGSFFLLTCQTLIWHYVHFSREVPENFACSEAVSAHQTSGNSGLRTPKQ